MDRRGGHTGASQLLGEPIRSVPGPAEHHRRAELAHHLGRALWSVGALDAPVHVTGGAHIGPGGADLVAERVTLHGSRQLADGAVERRREQQDLPCAIRLFDDPLHGREEPHVRHSVGLVDHDVVDVVERQRTHRDQVLEPAGAGNDEVDAGVERLALRAVPDAAVQRDHPASAVAGEGCDGVGDLLGQLARRGEHERSRSTATRRGQVQHQRQPEGQRLAGTGRRTPGHVTAGQHVGDDSRLDGRRLQDPGSPQARH